MASAADCGFSTGGWTNQREAAPIAMPASAAAPT